jgi:hypothetical protein
VILTPEEYARQPTYIFNLIFFSFIIATVLLRLPQQGKIKFIIFLFKIAWFPGWLWTIDISRLLLIPQYACFTPFFKMPLSHLL